MSDRTTRDNIFILIMGIVALAAIILLATTVYRLASELTRVENQVETNRQNVEMNTQNIEEQKEPCTSEDVKSPEEVPGC